MCVRGGEMVRWWSRGIPTGGGPREGREGWGALLANLRGLQDGTQCDLSLAICSSINPGCIYTHCHSHYALCGDKDVAISECEEGAGSRSCRTGGVPFCETRVWFKHALWAATYHCMTAGSWSHSQNSFSIKDCSQGQSLTTNTLLQSQTDHKFWLKHIYTKIVWLSFYANEMNLLQVAKSRSLHSKTQFTYSKWKKKPTSFKWNAIN